MTLNTIKSKIDSIVESVNKENYTNAKNTLNELLSIYKNYRDNQQQLQESLEYILYGSNIELTGSEEASIREQRRLVGDAAYRRTAFIQTSQALIDNPSVVGDTDYSTIAQNLKEIETSLNGKADKNRTITNDNTLAPKLIIRNIKPQTNPVPFQKVVNIDFSIVNVGDSNLSNATVKLFAANETLCTFEFSNISSGEEVNRSSVIRIPKSGNQQVTISVIDPQTDTVKERDNTTVDIFGKFNFGEAALSDLKTLYELIESADFVGQETRERWLTKIESARTSCEQARDTAKLNPDGSKPVAKAINSEFTASENSLNAFFEDYSEYYAQNSNQVPPKFHRTTISTYSSAGSRLRRGREAGLRQSGETGGNDQQESPLCETISVNGRRTSDGRIFTGGQTNRVIIDVDEVTGLEEDNIKELRILDQFPPLWEVGEYGDNEVVSEGVVDLGTINPEDVPHSFSYFMESPENVEETGIYTSGPAICDTGNSSVEFTNEQRFVVVAIES